MLSSVEEWAQEISIILQRWRRKMMKHKAERLERNPLFLLRRCDGDTMGIVKCEKSLLGETWNQPRVGRCQVVRTVVAKRMTLFP